MKFKQWLEDIESDDVCGIYPPAYIGIHPAIWGAGNPYVAASRNSDKKKKHKKKKKKED